MDELTDLGSYLTAPATQLLRRSERAGITVLIPTYSRPADPSGELLVAALDSIGHAAAAVDLPLSVLIVDNGLTESAAGRLADQLRAQPAVDYAIVGHRREPGLRYQAAQARNAGLRALAGEHLGLCREFLLFLDDDTEFYPDALRRLVDCLHRQPAAVAAFPTVARSDSAAQAAIASNRPERRVPGPWLPDGRFAIMSTLAYGSNITARALGLLVRAEAVPPFFEGTPMGSCEDILFSSLVARHGEIWSVPAAVLLDRPRTSPGAVRRQRLLWGYDHAWLFAELVRCALVPAGLHRLDWDGEGGDWLYSRDAESPVDGAVVNSEEVGHVVDLIAACCGDHERRQALFGALADSVAAGAERFAKLAGALPVAEPVSIRLDLPPLAQRDYDSISTGLDSLIGQVAGNLAGSNDFGTFMSGVRQSGDWPDADKETPL